MSEPKEEGLIIWEFMCAPIIVAILFVTTCPIGQNRWIGLTVGGLALVMMVLHYRSWHGEINKQIPRVGFWIIMGCLTGLAFISIAKGLGFLEA